MHETSSKIENFAYQECKQKKKNRFTPVKLESKKQGEKVVTEVEGLRWKVPIDP